MQVLENATSSMKVHSPEGWVLVLVRATSAKACELVIEEFQ